MSVIGYEVVEPDKELQSGAADEGDTDRLVRRMTSLWGPGCSYIPPRRNTPIRAFRILLLARRSKKMTNGTDRVKMSVMMLMHAIEMLSRSVRRHFAFGPASQRDSTGKH